jgi:hypothetical protein
MMVASPSAAKSRTPSGVPVSRVRQHCLSFSLRVGEFRPCIAEAEFGLFGSRIGREAGGLGVEGPGDAVTELSLISLTSVIPNEVPHAACGSEHNQALESCCVVAKELPGRACAAKKYIIEAF